MATSHKRTVPHNVLQEYLQALADSSDEDLTHRQHRLLLSYAELQYQLHGGGHCAVCQASVRHVLPVRAEHRDGTIAEFGCLCTRCLEGERMISNRVTLTVGQAHLEYTAATGVPRNKTFRAYT
jgi:hypothetical protein